VPAILDHRLVRGFDYYTRTTFEFASSALEAAQNGIGGGGRYDGLVEMLGGPPTPGIGFGIGIERLLLACDAESVFVVDPPPLDAFVVDVTGGVQARDLVDELRRAGLRAERAYDSRSMKAQLKRRPLGGPVASSWDPTSWQRTVSLRPREHRRRHSPVAVPPGRRGDRSSGRGRRHLIIGAP
jgi:hypothetical protein